jgi:hypothetical protein
MQENPLGIFGKKAFEMKASSESNFLHFAF